MPSALLGIVAGAAAAYMLDPVQGRRRRALVRDKMVAATRQGREFADAAARDFRYRAQGIKSMWSGGARDSGDAPDEVLISRVRAKLGRYVSHPKAVRVACVEGRIELSGKVLAAEHAAALSGARSVRGVREVADRLTVHESAEGVSSLQGGVARGGEPYELLQHNWSPAVRVVSGGAGSALAAYGLMRGGLAGLLALIGGGIMLARAGANRPLSELSHALPRTTTGKPARIEAQPPAAA
jgi:hypothetical protein